jgi:hypothetical protein
MSAETTQGEVEVGNGRQNFATPGTEAPNIFTGKPVELEDWLEAVHIYFALCGQTGDKITCKVLNQFLSADDKPFECGSVTLLSLMLSIRVMFEIFVETTA